MHLPYKRSKRTSLHYRTESSTNIVIITATSHADLGGNSWSPTAGFTCSWSTRLAE